MGPVLRQVGAPDRSGISPRVHRTSGRGGGGKGVKWAAGSPTKRRIKYSRHRVAVEWLFDKWSKKGRPRTPLVRA